MAIRDTLAEAMAHVANQKSTARGDGFLTEEQKKTFLKTYAPDSIATTRADFITAVGGSRAVSYTIATMTSGEKTSTGFDKMAPAFITMFSAAGSNCVHEGSVGDFIIEAGTKLYHIVGANPNESDFIDYKKLLEYHMAYSYVNDAVSESTSGEILASLAEYNTFKNSL